MEFRVLTFEKIICKLTKFELLFFTLLLIKTVYFFNFIFILYILYFIKTFL
jgi:hypothetical protein